MPGLRIALLTYSTKPRGGVVHTLSLAEALARAGQQVTVWTLARGGDTGFFRPVDAAVRVCAVPFPDRPDEGVGPRVQRSIALLAEAFAAEQEQRRAAAEPGYDVVHAQDCITANAVPGRLRTVHHIDHFSTPELVACHQRALLQPSALVCVSATVAAELEAETGRTASVIPNGVDAARFAAAAGDGPEVAARRRQWVARFGRYVLAVGGIEPRKGTLDLVRAMAPVRQRLPGSRLVIAGGDTLFDYREYRHEVEALAQRLRVAPVILGPVDHDQLPSLVAAAGVFAFPSLQEGFGLAAMEALAAGVPVVVRDLPVFREVFAGSVRFADVGDGSSADVAAGLAAQLSTALRAPGGLSAAAGRALAARHGWDDTASAHLSLYHRLISDGRPVGSSASSSAGPPSQL